MIPRTALLRMKISCLPPDARAELRRMRMTALELGIPEDTLWMFLPQPTPVPRRRRALRVRGCLRMRGGPRTHRTLHISPRGV